MVLLKTNIRTKIAIAITLLGSAAILAAVNFFFVHRLINAAYYQRSLPFINRIIEGRDTRPLDLYLGIADRYMYIVIGAILFLSVILLATDIAIFIKKRKWILLSLSGILIGLFLTIVSITIPNLAGQTFFAFTHYATLFIFAISSFFIGKRINRSVRFQSTVEELFFCTTLGIGVIAYIVLFLGLVGLLYSSVVILLVGLGLALSFREIHLVIRRLVAWLRNFQMSQATTLLPFLPLLFLLPILLMPLYPPSSWDALSYHLPVAKIFADKHRIVLTPYLPAATNVLTIEMLFSLMLLIADDIMANLISLLLLLLTALATFSFSKRYISTSSGFIAVSALLSSPIVIFLGTTCYIDIGLALFVTAAGYGFANWASMRDTKWLCLSAIFTGFAIGTKYSALFFVLLIGAAIVIMYMRRKAPLKDLLVFLVIAALIGSPWYIRNYYLTGNPVFPFFTNIFGENWLWNSVDSKIQQIDLIKRYGTGKNMASLILLPINIVFNWRKFHSEGLPLWTLSPFFSLFIPFWLIKRPRNKIVSWALLFGGLYVLFWFFTSQIARYLLPITSMLSIGVGYSVDKAIGWISKRSNILNKRFAMAIIGVILLAPSLYFTFSTLPSDSLPMTLKERNEWLKRLTPSFETLLIYNSIATDKTRIYIMYESKLAYYTRGVYLGSWAGPARYSKIEEGMRSSKSLYRKLRSLQVDYLLANTQLNNIALPYDSQFNKYFQLVASKNGAALYKLKT